MFKFGNLIKVTRTGFNILKIGSQHSIQNSFLKSNANVSYFLNKKDFYGRSYAFSTCSTFVGWENVSKELDKLLKSKSLTLEELENNTIKHFLSTGSSLDQYISKYSDAFQVIENIPKTKFLDEILQDQDSLNDKDRLQTILRLFILHENKIAPLEDYTGIDLAFYIMSITVLKSSDSPKKTLIDICERNIDKMIENYDTSKERTKGEIGYLKWTLMDFFYENKKLWENVSITLQNFIITLLKSDPIFRKDLYFLHTLTKRISHNPKLKQSYYQNQLLPHETPFENLVPKVNKLDSTTIGSDSRDILTEEIITCILEFINSPSLLGKIADLNKCLEILVNTNFKIFTVFEQIDKKFQDLFERDEIVAKDLINYCNLLIQSPDYTESYAMEILRKSLRKIYNKLFWLNLEKAECVSLYVIFRQTQSVHIELLEKIEAKVLPMISDISIPEFINLFYFYSSLPESIPKGIRTIDIITKLKKADSSFENLLDIAMASIFFDYQGKVSSIPDLPTLDGDLWNKIFDSLLSVKVDKLSIREKMKVYRTLRILSFILEGEVFNNQLIKEKMASLQNEVEKLYDPIESEFQKEVENYIKDRSYKKEALIEGTFSVDFLIAKKKVLEVNGPQHYYLVYGSDEPKYLENRSTAVKRNLLTNLGYHFISIPFYEWMNLESKKRDYVVKLFK